MNIVPLGLLTDPAGLPIPDHRPTALAEWRARLADAPTLLDLPTDHPRPASPTDRVGRLPVSLPALRDRVHDLAAAADAPPRAVLLAGFIAVLARYSGQQDITVGTPAGDGSATLPVRLDLAGDPSFRHLVGRVRQAVGEVRGGVSLEQLVEDLRPARMAGVNPLFQVGFSFGPEPAARGLVRLDLSLALADPPAGFTGTMDYAEDLFERPTVERLAGHLGVLLQAAVADPDRPVGQLPMLTDGERTTILGPWAGEVIDRPAVRTLTELLDAQARRTPDAPAVHCGRCLTYAELHAAANRLAHHLRSLGVGPGTLVGIALDRTPDLVAAVLAVLKAGGAYVPLDPAYPADRIATILADARAPVLVTQASLRDGLPPADTVVCLDTEAATLAGYPESNPDPVGGPDDLAYVIYTSGSTGKPKGVALEHRSAIELVRWAADTYPPDELAGVLFATSVCFDLSVFEMFVPLCLGGSVVLAENALQLPEHPDRDRVTLVNTVPSAASVLVRTGGFPASVRVVNLAGEPLPDALAAAVYAVPTVEKVYNLYGPTEDTVYSTCRLVGRGEKVHLGRPLPNTRAYILDRHGQPVPAGVPGELHLAGAGLARGYLNRPDLTAERFVPDPFHPGGRMYRTGDLCRWRGDGTIDFLGRIDHQVKVRGFRVELGEIEAELRRQPGVQQALVTAADDPAGGKRLVAYVAGEPLPTAADLRAGLRRALPEYMVQAAIVPLAAFPLTPNGKVDRKRLPAPDFTGRGGGDPADELERRLAAIWQETLGVSPVGTADDFFDLGGHSLLGVRLLAAVEKAFGRRLPLAALVDHPTVGRMAKLVRQAGPEAEVPLLTCFQHGPGTPLFCVPGQGDRGLQFRDLVRHLNVSYPVHAFSFERWERDPALFHTLEELAGLFVAEVRRVQPRGPYRLAGFCFGGLVAFEMARQLRAAGDEVEALVLIEAFGPPHLPETNASRGERLRQLVGFFGRLPLARKVRFLADKAGQAFGKVLGKLRRREPGPAPAPPTNEVGARFTYLTGVYPARPVAVAMTVIRATVQPDWYRRFGFDAPDLGWAGFGRLGVRSVTVPGSREEMFRDPALGRVAALLRSAVPAEPERSSGTASRR